jgi:hypothetical protein
MEINRRQLFVALSACFAGPLAEALAETLPIPEKKNRHWEGGVEFTGFKPIPSSLENAGQIIGRRSDDGQFFHVSVVLSAEAEFLGSEARMAYVRDRLARGMIQMDTYLEERCTCSSRIIGYREIKDEEGLLGDPGEVHLFPIHPSCEVHPYHADL